MDGPPNPTFPIRTDIGAMTICVDATRVEVRFREKQSPAPRQFVATIRVERNGEGSLEVAPLWHFRRQPTPVWRESFAVTDPWPWDEPSRPTQVAFCHPPSYHLYSLGKETAYALAAVPQLAWERVQAAFEAYLAGRDSSPGSCPPDFMVTLRYQNGSLPPPHHFEYEITLGPGLTGTMGLRPDYADSFPDPWVESFSITPHQRQACYEALNQGGAFDRDWPQSDDPAVGGSSRSLSGIHAGQPFAIPADLAGEDAPVAPMLFDALEQLVPEAVRERLKKRHQAWMRQA